MARDLKLHVRVLDKMLHQFKRGDDLFLHGPPAIGCVLRNGAIPVKSRGPTWPLS